MSFSTVPLQIATFCGAIVSAIAIIYGIIIIAQTLITGIDVPGYATTIVVVLFLGGVQLVVEQVRKEGAMTLAPHCAAHPFHYR